MVTKVLGVRGGLVMSNIERWWTEERSYGITGASISFSIFFLALGLGLYIGLRYQKSHLTFDGNTFVSCGVMQIEGNGRKIYVPIYEELKR